MKGDKLKCRVCMQITIDIYEQELKQICVWCKSDKLVNISVIKRRKRKKYMQKKTHTDKVYKRFAPKELWLPRWIAEL